MKKKFVLIAAVALTLAGCSQSDSFTDDEKETSTAIGFDGAFVQKTGRALGEATTASVNNLNTNDMSVYGTKTAGNTPAGTLFDGTTQVKSDGTGNWTYEGTKYWDKNAEYNFYAVMPCTFTSGATLNWEEVSGNPATAKALISNIPVRQTLSGVIGAPGALGEDILVATGGEKLTYAVGKVNFAFHHILSKFKVFVGTTCASNTFTVNGLKLGLPKSTEKVDYVQGASGSEDGTYDWTGSSTSDIDYEYVPYIASSDPQSLSEVAVAGITTNFVQVGEVYLMAPTEYDLNLKMYLQYTIDGTTFTYGDADDVTKGVEVQDLHTFTQNYVTNLYILIKPEAIVFDVETVSDWEFKGGVLDWNDSDNNWVDEEGYSFNLTAADNNSFNNPAPKIGGTVVVTIDNYGNINEGTSATPISYTPSCVSENVIFGDVSVFNPTTGAGEATFDVILPDNTTGDVKSYEIIVTTSQNDVRKITLWQAKL